MEDSVILINPFRVPKDKLQEAIAFWEQCRDFLCTQPGYVSTTLHQALEPDATFQLINVATWSSPAAFQDAIQAMQQTLRIDQVEGLDADPALYRIIRT